MTNSGNDNALSRLKSVRSKPQSFGGWKELVRNICREDDLQGLQEGHTFWKVRRKLIVGITWYRRKYRLDLSDLCIKYADNKFIDVATITEVRKGFSTDTFNDLEKMIKKDKKAKIGMFKADNCFSIIFDPR
jgi:hypothetical protein